jgi:exosortase C (VPDSG-CTERM-specific)
MKSTGEVTAEPIAARRTGTRAAWRDLPQSERLRLGSWIGCTAVLTLLFAGPLMGLVAHALEHSLHSHIPLVPVIAGYLFYIRPAPRAVEYRRSLTGALVAAGFGLAALAVALGGRASLSTNDYLAAMTGAYLAFALAGGFLFLGWRWMASAAFPLAFLGFMIPLPDAAAHGLEMALVAASADASELLFRLTGTPLLREGMFLTLPGIVLEVARECSGIRSTWVLFITSLVASHVFLKSPWRRFVLVAVVLPLGVVRNAFRILVIGLLSVQVGPHMADSVIHHRGGPIFFALSLVPLFALAWWLRRGERRRAP